MEYFKETNVVESGTSSGSLSYIAKDERESSNTIDAYFLIRWLALKTKEMMVSELEDGSWSTKECMYEGAGSFGD